MTRLSAMRKHVEHEAKKPTIEDVVVRLETRKKKKIYDAPNATMHTMK